MTSPCSVHHQLCVGLDNVQVSKFSKCGHSGVMCEWNFQFASGSGIKLLQNLNANHRISLRSMLGEYSLYHSSLCGCALIEHVDQDVGIKKTAH